MPGASTTGIARRTNGLTLGTGFAHLVDIGVCAVMLLLLPVWRFAQGAGSSPCGFKSKCRNACQFFHGNMQCCFSLQVIWWVVVHYSTVMLKRCGTIEREFM